MQPGFAPPARSAGPAAAVSQRSRARGSRGSMAQGRGSPSNMAQGGPQVERTNSGKVHDGEAVRERFEGQFFKTKLCVFWEKGRCVRGSLCKYAHGHQELQAMPDLTNTAMCRMMAETGRCNRPNCLYAHSHESLRATDNFYKTTMCSFFRYGRCRLGTLCRHAHSETELRKAKAAAEQDAKAAQADMGRIVRNNRNGGMVNDAQSSTSASGSGHEDFDDMSSSARVSSTSGTKQMMDSTEPEDDEEEPDFGEDVLWDRIATMPATLEQPHKGMPKIKAGSKDDGYSRERSNAGIGLGRAGLGRRGSVLWADLQEEDEDQEEAPRPAQNQEPILSRTNSLDSLGDMGDMWARMQTTPATFGTRDAPMRQQQQVVMMMVPVHQAQMMMGPTGQQPMMMPANFSGPTLIQQPTDGSWNENQNGMQPGMQASLPAGAMLVPAPHGMDASGMAPMCMPAMMMGQMPSDGASGLNGSYIDPSGSMPQRSS